MLFRQLNQVPLTLFAVMLSVSSCDSAPGGDTTVEINQINGDTSPNPADKIPEEDSGIETLDPIDEESDEDIPGDGNADESADNSESLDNQCDPATRNCDGHVIPLNQ